MKPGIPWSVKGIGPDVREAAKHAARRSGMTVGEWLNTVILDQSAAAPEFQQEPNSPPAKLFSPGPSRSLASTEETTLRLEDIAQQLSRLAQRDRETASVNYDTPVAAQADTDMLTRILGRIESNERQTVEAFTAVNERLSILGRQIAQAARQKAFDKPEDVAGYPALETALRNVVDHMEASEKRTRDTLKTLQDRMAGMAQRATTADSPAVSQSAPAFVSLENRLSELADRVNRSESKVQGRLPELVRSELSHLAERIDMVRETSETLAKRAQTTGVQAAQQELRAIEARILTLLNEAQATLAVSAGNGVALDQLRSEIGTLNQRIDDVRKTSASERDMQALRGAVEQLSTRVAQGPDLRSLADMDRRLADVTKRLEQSQARPNPQFSDLERRITELDRRLEDATRQRDDGQALSTLQRQIAAVDERVGRTEQQLSHLETIERSISQLYESLEQNRKTMKDVAEDAASRMADRILSSGSRTTGPSPELAAMEEGLRAVRASAHSADQRNQESLAAVHDTLEQIVTKLSALEAAAADRQLAAAKARETAAKPFGSAAPPIANLTRAQPAQRVDTPLPQSDAPAPVASSDDFMVAARRAAQAAAKKTAFPARSLVFKPADVKSKFQLPFLKSKTSASGVMTSASGAQMADAGSYEGKRRRLLLAGIVLLAAVSAISFNLLGRSAKPPQTEAKEQSLIVPKKQSQQERLGTIKPKIEVGVLAPDDIVQEKQGSARKSDGLMRRPHPAPRIVTSEAALVADPGIAPEVPIAPQVEIGSKALRDAATRGDAAAQFIIASRYFDGKPVEQDDAKAAYWYRQAASRGLPPAQYRIATLFERGRGVPQDLATAFFWYERAANNGNVKAMHNAAVIAAGNQLGAPNYERALKWFTAAAARGQKDSQFNLAVLHERGLGTKASSADALFWYMLAGQEDADAAKRASDLARTLVPSAVAEVAKRVKAWKPEPTAGDANVVAVGDDSWKDGSEASAPAKGQSSTADPVYSAQRLLAFLGFNVTPDGTLDTRTASAIRLFQLQAGMKVTGQITPRLIEDMQQTLG